MDWLSSVDQLFAQNLDGYGEGAVVAKEEQEDIDADDFYEPSHDVDDNGDLGANSTPPKTAAEVNGVNVTNGVASNQRNFLANSNLNPPSTQKLVAEKEQMTENQKKAEYLRAKLLAKRQGTPTKQQQPNGISTESRYARASLGPEIAKAHAPKIELKASSGDSLGLDALLAEGKAAAEARNQEQAIMKQQQTNGTAKSRDAMPPPAAPVKEENQLHKHKPIPAAPKQTQARATEEQQKAKFNQPAPPQLLTDDYYADLPLWLEMTGFHDVDYRNSKLRTFKERQSLEAEAAKIQERLDKLREAEQAAIQSLRSTPAPRENVNHAPPPALPKVMPSTATSPIEQNGPATNGIKRAHSPDLAKGAKTRRQESPDTYRVRGGGNIMRGRARSPSPRLAIVAKRRGSSFDRIEYSPELNREAIRRDDARDPSLERRRSYYQSYQPEPIDVRREGYDRPPVRGDHGGYRGRGRGGYGDVSGRDDDRGRQHVDVARGGVRYFMIKSWNHENVTEAMRDGLWATQEKNERALTDAYHNSRHVVLLFSVNKSTAFQGYALMASPPDPSLPKPAFCNTLRWTTSPAFRLRWMATSSVPYRRLGGLKNRLNVDEQGKPMAVFIGFDGQEIEGQAGRGVVEVLDEEEEGRAREGNGR